MYGYASRREFIRWFFKATHPHPKTRNANAGKTNSTVEECTMSLTEFDFTQHAAENRTRTISYTKRKAQGAIK